MDETFKEIYDKNIWGSSGSGSKWTRNNKKYVELLFSIIKEYNIKTICDFGCGDWEINKHIDWKGLDYTGVDCVENLVKNNIKNYSAPNVKFKLSSVDAPSPTGYDLVIIKDVLQHHTDEYVLNILPRIIKENKYVITINGYRWNRDKTKNDLPRNIDNRYRFSPIDFRKEPFNEIKGRVADYVCYTKLISVFTNLNL